MTEEIKNILKILPPEIKAVFQSEQKIRTVFEISQKYDLYELDFKIILNEVDMILLNLEDLESLKENIEKEAELSPDIASKIASEIDEKIFAPIRNSLLAIQKERKDQEIEDEKQKPVPSQNLPSNLPVAEKEERELVVQAPIKQGLPKTFGEKTGITPAFAKPSATPPNLGGMPSPRGGVISQPANTTPQFSVLQKNRPIVPVKPATPPKPPISPNDEFFVVRKKPANIIEAKLGGFNMPQEKLDANNLKPESKPATDPNKKVDPYREPID